MKIQKKDLIFIHKFIWSHIYNEVEDYKDRNIYNFPLNFNIKEIKNEAINLLLDNEIITNTMYYYLTYNSCCILCLIFRSSKNGCNDCPLKDCNSPLSMYQQVRKGSLSAIRAIYYSIDKAFIPDYIEIPEE